MGEGKITAADMEWYKDRARCHDAVHPGELLGHIAALEAELARLKPSGQVAEMRERLGGHLMDWAPTPFAGQSAMAELDRLATKAEGYEAWRDLAAQHQLDAAKYRDEVAGAHGRIAAIEHRLKRVEAERDAAVADNAALLRAAKFWETMLVDVVENGAGADLGWMNQSEAAKMLAVIRADHPGAALLEELATLRGVQAQAQVDAKFIHDALGWAGEWPKSLPAPSRAVVALLEKHREALAAAERRHETTRATMYVREQEHRKEVAQNERKTLCLVLDELGADGAAEFLGDATNEQLHKSIWTHVRWLEARARNEGLKKAAAEAMARADPGCEGAEQLATLADDLRAMMEPEQ